MRPAATVLMILCSALAVSAQTNSAARKADDRTADEAALQKLNASIVEALSAGNYKRAALLWDEDGVYFSVPGDKITGPAQIEATLSDTLQGAKISIQITNIHWVSPDIAALQGSWQTATSDGQGSSGLFMAVVRRRGSDWKYVEIRPWIPEQ